MPTLRLVDGHAASSEYEDELIEMRNGMRLTILSKDVFSYHHSLTLWDVVMPCSSSRLFLVRDWWFPCQTSSEYVGEIVERPPRYLPRKQ